MYIAAYKGRSLWPSRMIEWFSWSPYSHVSLVYENGSEVEAWSDGGVQRLGRDKWGANHTPGTPIDFYEYKLNLTQEEIERGEEFIKAQIGKKYDWRGVMRFISRRSGNNQDRWFCSELVHAWSLALDPHGWRALLSNVPSYKIMPGMITYSPLLRKVWSDKVPKR